MSTSLHPPRALLFDLGGVVLALDFEQMFEQWAALSPYDAAEIRQIFAADRAYEAHETGQLCGVEYFDHVRGLLRLQASDAEIAAGWNALLAGEIEQSIELINRCRGRLPCYAFSNTNPTHEQVWSRAYPRITGAFDQIFTSCALGLRKPDPAAYYQVAEMIGLVPQDIVFFDDLPGNVTGAQRTGMRGVTVRQPDDIAAALHDLGIVC